MKNDDVCSQWGISCKDDAPDLRASLEGKPRLSDLFKALGDETRIRVLRLLANRPLCVCDLAFLLGMSLPAVSHHLRILKSLRLLASTREGKMVFYRLADDHVSGLLAIADEHYGEPGSENIL